MTPFPRGPFSKEWPASRCAQLHYTEQIGITAIADSPDEVRKRTRLWIRRRPHAIHCTGARKSR